MFLKKIKKTRDQSELRGALVQQGTWCRSRCAPSRACEGAARQPKARAAHRLVAQEEICSACS